MDLRRRIMQLARGKFDYAGPNLSLPGEKLELDVLEGRDESGTFTISSTNDVVIRGVVYVNHSRMEVLTPQFEGQEARIRYQFHSEGLVEGDIQKGNFTILCNGAEYNLPFCVSISRLYPESSVGKIKNLYDFAKLAKNDWKEAYHLFYSKNFPSLINPKEVQEELIYRGLSKAKPSNQNLEEFLVGIGKKERVKFSVEKTEYTYHDLTETQKETIEIRKDQWGYLGISVTSDNGFIRLDKTLIESEDFVGSTYELCYYLLPEAMHGGRNFGKITLETVYQKVSITVMAEQTPEMEELMVPLRTQIKECKVGIMELYQAYRLKRIVTGVWANETIEILTQLQALEPEVALYGLMKAQVYIINRQRQEADWILNDFKHNCIDRKSIEWAYYLYIISLMEREPSYVDKLTDEIRMIFREHPDSVFLFWILTFLEEKYVSNHSRKLKDIAYWIDNGCTSPYLYIEAFYLIWQDPFLLTKLDSFERKILRWAIRHKALTKDIAIQIFEITKTQRSFDPVVFEFMCAAYHVNPKPEHLALICGYLIKGQKYDTRYHGWYQKGIELEIRLTGLYEAYLLSMDSHEITKVPKIIQMYFQYDTPMPYKKLAVLYANIIAARYTEQEVYQKYKRTMGRFAMEQAEQEHMDDNLAILYKDMLDTGLINREIAHGLSKILFTYKLVVYDKRMVRAVVYERQTREPQIVPITEHEAYVRLSTKEFVILFEDKEGRRYAGNMQYQLQKLMDPSPYIEKCMELAGDELSYVIYYFDTKPSYLTFEEKDEKFFPRILYGQDFSTQYQREMIPEIIRYYQSVHDNVSIEKFLEQVDLSILNVPGRRFLLELMVEHGFYQKAYGWIQKFGMDYLSSAGKVTLASAMLEETEYGEDEYLVSLCADAFRNQKYNDHILEYLAIYYQGATTELIRLWKSCEDFQVDTKDLEERILTQLLYVGCELPEGEEIFRSYLEKSPQDFIVLAYLSMAAHGYFVENRKISPYVLAVIESRYCHEQTLNDACRLALFRYLSEEDQWSDKHYQIGDELLSMYTRRGMYFAFYKKLDERLIQKYHLYDKVFLEYRTNPKSHVVLHYSGRDTGSDFVVEEIPNVYDGIFVKQFVMFFGDVVQYYISDELDGRTQMTESARLTNNDLYGQKDRSRYNLINQMLISNTLQDQTSLYRNMKQYQGLDTVTEKLFTLLKEK